MNESMSAKKISKVTTEKSGEKPNTVESSPPDITPTSSAGTTESSAAPHSTAAKIPPPSSQEENDEEQSGHDSDYENASKTLPPKPASAEFIAGLAAQVLSAQIVGIAQYQTLAEIWRELRSTLVSLTSLLQLSNDTGGGPAEVAAALRAKLMQAPGLPRKPEILGPFGLRELSSLADSSLFIAERLLIPRESEDEILFAEQMFDVDERLSQHGIFKRFESCKWPGLTGVKTFNLMIEEIDACYARLFQKPPSGESGDGSATFRESLTDLGILYRAREICAKRGTKIDRDPEFYKELGKALGKLIQIEQGPPMSDYPRVYLKELDFNMIQYFFDDKSPEDRHLSRAKSDTKQKSADRFYRPWGLFRYLRLYGEDEKAVSLNKKLKIERRDWKGERAPKKLHPGSYGMGALERFVYDDEP